MNKQDAVDFIVEELEKNRSQEAIAQDLAVQLQAPYEAVIKFVAQVVAGRPRPEELGYASAQSDAPDEEPSKEGQRLSGRPISKDEQGEAQAEAEALMISEDESQPEEAVETLEREATAEAEQQNAGEQFAEPQYARPMPFSAQASAEAVQATPVTREAGPAQAMKAGPSSKALMEQPELVTWVVSQLKKDRKRNDIAVEICERSGAEWKQAQRFVAQVEVEQRQAIATHKNVPMMFFGILFITAGILLALVGLAALAPYITALFGIEFRLPLDVPISLDLAFGGFITGLVLILGGLAGLFFAARSQMDS